jgi:ankyrin repeat protein
MTAFWYCYQNNKVDLALYLVEKGADVNQRDNYGFFVLKHEILKGNVDMIRKLLKLGANLENRDEFERSSLHIAMN